MEASPCCSGGRAASNNKTEIELAIFPDSSDFPKKVARAFPLTHNAWGTRDRIRPTAKISLLPAGTIEVLSRSIHFGANGISTARTSAKKRQRMRIFYKISKL
jgi:hypothetical protein